MVKISIIIRTRNEAKSLERVFKRIYNQDTSLNYEIIIVDSCSTDGTKRIASSYGCKIVNLSPHDFSWGRGLNIGIENAKGEFCVLLSAHCYPVDGKWLDKLTKPLMIDEKVAASYGGQIPIKGVDPFEEVELKKWFPRSSKKLAISNSNACIRKSVWQKIKFNEALNSYEDVEWALRVQASGYKLRYIPEAAVYHSHKINVHSIYRRWYWRSRMAIFVRRNEWKIILASKFPPRLAALLLSTIHYITFLSEDIIHCIREKYSRDIWKAPFYELIRSLALYDGCRDGLRDVKDMRELTEFIYYQVGIPKIVNALKFIEKRHEFGD